MRPENLLSWLLAKWRDCVTLIRDFSEAMCMPRDASGNMTLPAGNPVVSHSTASSTAQNQTLADLAAEIQDSLSRSGKGGMLADLDLNGFVLKNAKTGSFAATIGGGFSGGNPTGTMYYIKLGPIAIIYARANIVGTSTDTLFNIGGIPSTILPAAAVAPSIGTMVMASGIVSNGATLQQALAGYLNLPGGGGVADFGGAAIAAGGAKGVAAGFFAAWPLYP